LSVLRICQTIQYDPLAFLSTKSISVRFQNQQADQSVVCHKNQ
jgi:hypothetical protein